MQNGGVWDTATDTCMMPDIGPPPPDAIMPTAEEQNQCDTNGGILRYDNLTATWACDAGCSSIMDETSCTAAALCLWIPVEAEPTPHPAMCVTAGPAQP
jgi:hypothetical protein